MTAETKELRMRRKAMDEDSRRAGCPGCSGALVPVTQGVDRGLNRCERCGGLVGAIRRARLESAASPVVPKFADGTDEPGTRYFDLMVISDDGRVDRFHGWYDPATRRVVQVG